MSLSARPHPITMYDKTTNIYVLVTFCTDSWRHLWGRRCTFNTFWSSDGPLFRHLRHGGLKRYDSLRLTGVSRTPTLLGCGFHPSSSHPRPSSLEAWTLSPTDSAYSTSTRRLATQHPSVGCPPSTLGCTTSTVWHLRFISSKLSAQTPL